MPRILQECTMHVIMAFDLDIWRHTLMLCVYRVSGQKWPSDDLQNFRSKSRKRRFAQSTKHAISRFCQQASTPICKFTVLHFFAWSAKCTIQQIYQMAKWQIYRFALFAGSVKKHSYILSPFHPYIAFMTVQYGIRNDKKQVEKQGKVIDHRS